MGTDPSLKKTSKNTEDYISPRSIDPNAKRSNNTEETLKKSSFGINNPHQIPNKQYLTTYESGFDDKSSLRNKTLYNFGNRPTIKVINQGKGVYDSDYNSKYPYKVNEITEKEIKEKKGVVEKIKKHHWDNGSKTGLFNTTHNQFFKFDYKGAKVANIPLTEEHKDDLRYSHYELGKRSAPFISTQFNSYLPNNNFKPTYSDGKLKNSSINFNPKFGNIKGSTVYMRDYTAKENE